MFWTKSIALPRAPYTLFGGRGTAGLNGSARKGHTVENTCAKLAGKGGWRRKIRVGRGIGG